MNTRDPGRVRLCAAAPSEGDNKTADLLAALELILPYATPAPAWALEAAQAAIKQAKEPS